MLYVCCVNYTLAARLTNVIVFKNILIFKGNDMESVFKFVLHRPAVQQRKDLVIDLSQNSDFQVELSK